MNTKQTPTLTVKFDDADLIVEVNEFVDGEFMRARSIVETAIGHTLPLLVGTDFPAFTVYIDGVEYFGDDEGGCL